MSCIVTNDHRVLSCPVMSRFEARSAERMVRIHLVTRISGLLKLSCQNEDGNRFDAFAAAMMRGVLKKLPFQSTKELDPVFSCCMFDLIHECCST